MRYIDTNTRDPKHALGSWLDENVLRDHSVIELRCQAGFFGADSLGYFAASFARLQSRNGILRILIGSNEGMTLRGDVEILLRAAGPSRANQQIGIVKFESGYFHPKTVHVVRGDSSSAGYVGSANLTGNGLTLHVEAGILLDTREGDDPAVVTQVASAIDWWFIEPRQGLSLVRGAADLDELVSANILDVPRPARPRPSSQGKSRTAHGVRLAKLLQLPSLPAGALAVPPPEAPPPQVASAPAPALPAAIPSERYAKRLSASDAQRKPSGNQRGSVTLVKAGYPINRETYFRYGLFKDATWVRDTTNTGEVRETAMIPFTVNFLGNDLGVLSIPVTYAANRESQQSNYTSLIHWGPLSRHISGRDVTGKWLVLERHADGSYALSIREEGP